MRSKLKLIESACVLLSVSLATFPAGAATAATPGGKEFWISTNPSAANLGTRDDPFDGSTPSKFDAAMNHLPPGCTLHILPGTFQTRGNSAWNLKSSQKVLGSGIDVTTLQLVPRAPDDSFVLGSYVGTNIVVSDLTLDCNYTGGAYTYHGLGLVGTSNTVRRVKVIHMARASLANSESWGIIITASPVPDSEGNVIEDCEVSQFAGGSGCSAVSFNGGVTNAISGIIRNNRIRLAPTNGAAINGSWTHDCLIEGNYIDGAQDGIYGDTGTSTDITVIRNTLRNCTHAISYHTAFRQNITIASNTIEIASRPVQVYPTAFYFNPNASYKNIIIRGNHVRNHGAPEATPRFLNACNISGLVVAGNTVDRSFTNILSGCKGVAMYDNFDLTGKLLTNIHQRASPNAASGTVVSNRVIYDGALHR